MSTLPSSSVDMAIAPRPLTASSQSLSLPHQEGDKLTRKQKLFVEYWLQGKSAYVAAELAGYSPSTASIATTVILTSTQVIKEIRRRTSKVFTDLELDTDYVLEKAANLASANMLDYVDIKPDGTFEINLARVSRAQGEAIQELSFDAQGRPKIRMVDKKGSVELLARIKKMLNEGDLGPAGGKGEGQAITTQYIDQVVQEITVNQQVNVYQPQSQIALGEANKESFPSS